MTSPEGEAVDNSLAAITARLKILQPSLKGLLDKALLLFDDYHSLAPHPSERPNLPVYATSSMNICPIEGIPMSRELTVVLGSQRWIRVFRATSGAPNTYPRQGVWYSHPSPERPLQRKTSVIRTHSPSRVEIPYDIETSDFNSRGIHQGFAGGLYYKQEPFIAESEGAVDEARIVAVSELGVAEGGASGRIRSQRAILHSEHQWGIDIGAQGYVIPDA